MGAITGELTANPITFKEEDGMDFAATTVQLPDGERVPFLFSVKQLVASGEGSSFKPGFTWGGEFQCRLTERVASLTPRHAACTLATTKPWRSLHYRLMARVARKPCSRRSTRCLT